MADDALPAPLVSADTDVTNLDGFMLNVERLLASELLAMGTPEQCWAAFMLWCRAWKQVPGGSLPNDERILASFSGAGKRWKQVREVALHGFVLCSDGRFYHRFLCAEVQRASQKKAAYETRREADRKRLSEWRSQRTTKPASNEDETQCETSHETCFVAEETGTGTGTGTVRKKEGSDPNGSGAGAPPGDPVKAIFDRGVAILGEKGRSLLGKVRREYGDPAVLQAIIRCEGEHPSEPAAFFMKCLASSEKSTSNGRGFTIGVG